MRKWHQKKHKGDDYDLETIPLGNRAAGAAGANNPGGAVGAGSDDSAARTKAQRVSMLHTPLPAEMQLPSIVSREFEIAEGMLHKSSHLIGQELSLHDSGSSIVSIAVHDDHG